MRYVLIVLCIIGILGVSGCTSTGQVTAQNKQEHQIPGNTTIDLPSENAGVLFEPRELPEHIVPSAELIGYPTYLENPVFASTAITYYINDSIEWNYAGYYPEMINDTIIGLERWGKEFDFFTFTRVSTPYDADIFIYFVRNYEPLNVTKGDRGVQSIQAVALCTITRTANIP